MRDRPFELSWRSARISAFPELLLGCLGAVFIVVWGRSGSVGLWTTVLREFGVVLFASAVVSAIYRFVWFKDFNGLLSSLIDRHSVEAGALYQEFSQVGRLDSTVVRERLLELIKETSNTQITVEGFSLHSFFSDPAILGALKEALDRSVRLRVLMLDPGSDAARILFQQNSGREDADSILNGDEEHDRLAARQTLRLIAPLRERLGNPVEIRLFSTAPTAFVLLTDKGAVFQPHFLRHATAVRGPVMVIPNQQPNGERNPTYWFIRDQLEYLYESAKFVAAGSESILREEEHWNVFICHDSRDKDKVRRLAEILRQRGISAFTDDVQLRPGGSFERAARDLLDRVDSVVVFVGSEHTAPWLDSELRVVLTAAVQRQCIVIPVFDPEVSLERVKLELPAFLRDFIWVRFSNMHDQNAIDSLVWAITGQRVSATVEG